MTAIAYTRRWLRPLRTREGRGFRGVGGRTPPESQIRPMKRIIALTMFAAVATACVTEDDNTEELAASESSGDEGDVERVVYGPFTQYTIYPPPDTTIPSSWCPWIFDICDITCPSCNALTADHGHTCISCPQGDSDCNCAAGTPPFTDPKTNITFTNKWYPRIVVR